MKKQLVIFLIAVLILSQFIYAGRYLIKEVNTNVEGSLFNSWFTEPTEVCYLIMCDGSMYKFMSYESNKIKISIVRLEKDGYKISDIALVIHNHFVLPHFSSNDKNIFRQLYHKGFRGKFLLWRYKIKWIKQLVVVEKPALK